MKFLRSLLRPNKFQGQPTISSTCSAMSVGLQLFLQLLVQLSLHHMHRYRLKLKQFKSFLISNQKMIERLLVLVPKFVFCLELAETKNTWNIWKKEFHFLRISWTYVTLLTKYESLPTNQLMLLTSSQRIKKSLIICLKLKKQRVTH